MIKRRLLFAALMAAALPIQAAACELTHEDGSSNTALGDLPDGIFSGNVICADQSREVSVWTMTVDGGATSLGVRDNPLFEALARNPMIEVASIGYGDSSRFTLFRREQSVSGALRPGQPDRIFGTLCAADATSPLDCSIGNRRVKMRVDIRDINADGTYDHAFHEISVYDGADRLQVVYITSKYDERPQALVYHWLSVLTDTGAVELPG